MFDKYTEKARKAIFFARYEASQFGSERIETEHLLLGILREDRALFLRLLQVPEKVHSIRENVEKQLPRQEKISTSVDLPLSHDCKRVLTHAAEESERVADDHIGPEHLLLGLLRDKDCSAAKIMAEYGITPSLLEQARLPVSTEPIPVSRPSSGVRDPIVSEGLRDPDRRPRPDKGGARRQTQSADRAHRRTGEHHPDSLAPHQKQPGPDRRARRGEKTRSSKVWRSELPMAQCPKIWRIGPFW